MRAREQRMAEELRARGWTCVEPGDLVAVVRTSTGDVPAAHVAIYPAGVGEDNVRASFTAMGHQVPPRADRPSYVRPFVDMLAAQGYDIAGAWTSGVDARGRYASVPVRSTR